MAVVMRNFMGWDNVGTLAGQVERPQRNYTIALLISIPLIALLYLLPIGVGLAATQSRRLWRNDDIALIAAQVAGPWIGVMISIRNMRR